MFQYFQNVNVSIFVYQGLGNIIIRINGCFLSLDHQSGTRAKDLLTRQLLFYLFIILFVNSRLCDTLYKIKFSFFSFLSGILSRTCIRDVKRVRALL